MLGFKETHEFTKKLDQIEDGPAKDLFELLFEFIETQQNEIEDLQEKLQKASDALS